jgi:tRNA (guanine37-N1)-methyltransferase
VRIDVVTIFPRWFDAFFAEGIPRIVRDKGLVRFQAHNLRDCAEDRRGSVDDRPYGGGPGMVMMPGPVFRAVEAVEASGAGEGLTPPARRILLTPQGTRFDQRMAERLAGERWLLIVCGRYEGFDERIHLGLGAEEVSVGDYVLSGGEPAACAVMDAVLRLLPGALGDADSARRDTFADNRLSWPQYTRPPEFRGMVVPDVLLSGDHARIAEWRREEARRRTLARRPDLLAGDAGRLAQ